MNKICIVTGGTRGLGFSICKKLINDGKKVLVISRTCPSEFASYMEEHKDQLIHCVGNVSDDKRMKEIIDSICNEYEIEYLINNAGIIAVGPFNKVTKEIIKNVFETNVSGTMIVTRHCLPYMKKINSGKIVAIISSAGLLGKPQESIYCASKYAQRGYILSLREELKDYKINVVECYPGGINTSFYDNIRDYAPIEKTNKFMNADRLAEIICENLYCSDTLNISEIKIDRLK